MEPTLPTQSRSLGRNRFDVGCDLVCIDWMTLTKSQAVDCCFCTGARKMIISSFSCDHETPQRDHQSQIVTIRVPRFGLARYTSLPSPSADIISTISRQTRGVIFN